MTMLLLLLLLAPVVVTAERCHPDDKAAILKIKDSFSNGRELLPMWTADRDCCNTFDCDETTNRVIDFSLTNSNLAGPIPEAIGDLTYLKTLRLHKMPFLIGQIPRSLTRLKHVTFFDISWTNVSGHVPSFLSELKSVMILDLSFNNLSGPIPPSLATLPNMIGLDLSRNQLTGSIPESFGHLASPALQGLGLSHNMLSGEIPTSIGNMQIYRIDVSRNNLSGDASMLFGSSKNTSEIDISRNNFAFDLSRVTFMVDTLVTLDISHNKIYGEIPSQILEAYMLQSLNVSYNRLCGTIPSPWKLKYRSEGFDNSSFLHNKCLCGPPLAQC
ncbi:putative leucine-rich repeat domain superfamily [Helianthus annuus]|uniref:Leucine-rich repeat domain superfamily n=1 Tax=Helianthus annuus TaxID=4232 RepID=A0A251VPY1_HELAN|nr:polygalacturonase inhibitor [Helianthus annuus]KAF5822461.1 putative leucine-rich repeat domain superfamily [Helianthus annuus]KAJ0611929.1 putative leucine-rich repeat domain superfamily [Helianthus annuus]KAJ0627293.1 putative leucine-rich repeat domain superfamily [Helianthus annuus]KAJ0783600.1 putative leucine-rich repeat domain superfamily [Helianthus annuus]